MLPALILSLLALALALLRRLRPVRLVGRPCKRRKAASGYHRRGQRNRQPPIMLFHDL